MHDPRSRTRLHAVDALAGGRRLALPDLVRSWPGAERICAPLKAFDRLLGNCLLHAEREQVYRCTAHWLVRSTHPVVIIDWSGLKENRCRHLLRAAVPTGGRALSILHRFFPGGGEGSPKAEKLF